MFVLTPIFGVVHLFSVIGLLIAAIVVMVGSIYEQNTKSVTPPHTGEAFSGRARVVVSRGGAFTISKARRASADLPRRLRMPLIVMT